MTTRSVAMVTSGRLQLSGYPSIDYRSFTEPGVLLSVFKRAFSGGVVATLDVTYCIQYCIF